MATFEKRGNTWRYKVFYYDEFNKRKYATASGFRTKKEAKIAANDAEYEIEHKKSMLSSKNITFFDYYKNWVKVYKEPNVGKSSMNRFNNIGNVVINNYFHNVKLKEISAIDYQNFMNDYEKTRSTLTISKTNSIIRSCVQNAINDQIIGSDFTKNVILKGAPSRKRAPKFLTINQFQKVISYAVQNKSLNNITYYMILTAAYSGMRYEEIAGLTWNKVNFKKNTITIDQIFDYVDTKKIVKRTKTDSSKRIIPLLEPLKEILQQLYKAQMEWLKSNNMYNLNNFVFLNHDLSVPSNVGCSKSLKYIQDQVEIPRTKQIRMHGLRHTFASYLISQDAQLKYVSEFLGHKNTNITMKAYEHLLKEKRDKENQKANNAFKNLFA
ncbi:MAG: site-specific integrase [Lactobacillus sp.]|nr:site-specific integrase [Lactobacillus sp.]